MTMARVALAVALAVAPAAVHAADEDTSARQNQKIDTEHLFAFMGGSDVGQIGDKEIEGAIVGSVGKQPGSYGAWFPSLEYEFVPIENLRVSATAGAAYHGISGVAGLDDRRQWAFDAVSIDFRYQLIDRDRAGVGLTIDAEPQWGRTDETSGEPVDQCAVGLSLLIDKELVPDRIMAAFNLLYGPELSFSRLTGASSREQVFGTAAAVMGQIEPGVLIGLESRYLRRYDTLGFANFTGDAAFVGPTLYARLTEHLWIIAAWSTQLAGRSLERPGALNLNDFERQQIKLQFGLEF